MSIDNIEFKIADYNDRIKEEEEIIKPLETEFDSKVIPMVITMVLFFGSVSIIFFCTGIISSIGITSAVISGFYGKILGKNISALSKDIGVHMEKIDNHKREIEELKKYDIEKESIEVSKNNYLVPNSSTINTIGGKDYQYVKRL